MSSDVRGPSGRLFDTKETREAVSVVIGGSGGGKTDALRLRGQIAAIGTAWYLRRKSGSFALTVERCDDRRGYTMHWPDSIRIDAAMRRLMRSGLYLMRERLAVIDQPWTPLLYDPMEVDE